MKGLIYTLISIVFSVSSFFFEGWIWWLLMLGWLVYIILALEELLTVKNEEE